MKCFFFLRDSSGAFAGSLGVLFCDLDSIGDYAEAMAQALTGRPEMFVIASDQCGHELARAPIGQEADAPADRQRAATSSDMALSFGT